MHAKGVFITGTGTDVGKTFVTALLVKKFRDSGIDAFYYKAALSGASLNPDQGPASDEQYVKTIASLPETHETLVSYVYQEAVSPHLAARKDYLNCEKTHYLSPSFFVAGNTSKTH
jgi:dethiobiotin synthetase